VWLDEVAALTDIETRTNATPAVALETNIANLSPWEF
jgi:hypothetical protein